MNILIIGGGIAGSTLAIALGKVGLKATVLEARPTATDTGGAFLTLAPNGVNALRTLGLGELPREAEGFEQSGSTSTTRGADILLNCLGKATQRVKEQEASSCDVPIFTDSW